MLHFLCVTYVSLSFSFNQESGFVAGRRRRRRWRRRGETVAGRERADTGGVQSLGRMVRRDMLFQSTENEI